MGKEIDWTKAPEGATHWDNKQNYFCNRSGRWHHKEGWILSLDKFDWNTERYSPRPVSGGEC